MNFKVALYSNQLNYTFVMNSMLNVSWWIKMKQNTERKVITLCWLFTNNIFK